MSVIIMDGELLSISEACTFVSDYPRKFSYLYTAYNLLTAGTDENEFGQIFSAMKHTLLPLKIVYCNARESSSFSEAFVQIEQYTDYMFCFAAVFTEGCRVLREFLEENKIPQEAFKQIALRRLLTFLAKDFDAVVASKDVEFKNESEVCLFLMNHLISKLSSSDEGWKMDKGTKEKNSFRCPCSTTDCPLKDAMAVDDVFADLSIGNLGVWHGAVDAMTFSSKVPCLGLDEEGAGDTEQEVEYENSLRGSGSQLFAETIVNSFLQRKVDSGVSFVPCLGIKQNAIKVAMYDAELDILLVTYEMQFKGSDNDQLYYTTYLILWLICNFKIFSSPLNKDDFEILKAKRADFRTIVGDKLGIYQEKLRYQKVRRKGNKTDLKALSTTKWIKYPSLKAKRRKVSS